MLLFENLASHDCGNATSFYPTYEELKFLCHLQHIPKVLVFTLPMRNWNSTAKSLSDTLSIVFTLPMRNWNSSVGSKSQLQASSFYPTYEELKCCARQESGRWLVVFTLPMRNWNISLSHRYTSKLKFLPYLWGIEIAFAGGGIVRRPTVFTLPMRNWNSEHSIYLEHNNKFLPYLWGIEIFTPPFLWGLRNMFLPYLWGIEIFAGYSQNF